MVIKADPSNTDSLYGELGALQEATTIINEWKPASDVFALKNYMNVTGILNASSAAYFNSYYRKVVKLRNQAFITTLIPVVVLPSLVGTVLHHQFVLMPMLLQKYKCPVCLEIRGGALQFFSGIVYPMVLAPLAAFQFAVRLYTYPVPDITQPRLWIKEVYKLSKPIFPQLYLLTVLQIIMGTALTHWEGHNLQTVLTKLAHMEDVIDRRRQESPSPPHNY